MADADFAHLAAAHTLGGQPIPGVVRELGHDVEPELVWRNELGGLTFRIGERYLKWNPPTTGIGEGHQQELFDAYGIEPDVERIRWYRALWEMES